MDSIPHTGVLVTYEQFVEETAFFPQGTQRETFGYLGTALGGEAGELLNVIKKLLRDDGGVMTSARQAQIADEAGDVLWYLTATLLASDLTLTDALNANLAKISDRTAKRRAASAVPQRPVVNGRAMCDQCLLYYPQDPNHPGYPDVHACQRAQA